MRTYAPRIRDIETIDGELRLVARAWRIARVLSDRMPSTALIDQLLDERAHAGPRASTREFSTSCDKHLAAKELELIDWDAAESRAYIQGWLGGTEVTEDNITRVFAAVNKILTAGHVHAAQTTVAASAA